MTLSVDLSIVIPFYNEEENVEKVCKDLIREFNANNLSYEIITVNNGSYDNTPKLLKKLSNEFPQIKTVTVEVNQGYGWGVVQGLRSTTGSYVGYMAGDGQIKPEDVIKVFEKIKSYGLDFAQGKRITRHDGLLRKIVSRVFNAIFQILFPCPLTDVGSNPKIFSHSLYKKISPVSKDWFIDSEVIIKSSVLGARMIEVPLIFQKREKGISHIHISSIIEMLKNMIVWKIRGLQTKSKS